MWMFCRGWFELNVKGNERKPGNWSIFKRRYHCALLLPLWCCKKKGKCTPPPLPPTPTPSPFPPNLHIFKTKDGLHCAMAAQMKRESKYFKQLIGGGGRCSKVLAHLLDGLEDPEEVEARQLLQLVHRPVARVEEGDKELRVAGHVGKADRNPVMKIFYPPLLPLNIVHIEYSHIFVKKK